MGLLIVADDFVGKWDLAKSNDDKIDEYIAEYEEMYLIELLGKELFDLFKADVSSTTLKPVTPIYLTLYNSFTEKINELVFTSEGLKKMLLGLIFFQYVRDNRIKQTMNGAIEIQTEVSTFSESTFLFQRQNQAVQTYNAIQQYILDNKLDYPTFYGVIKRKSSFI